MWGPTLESVQLFLWGAQRARTVLHLCLENDAFKAPEHHLDRIWLEPTQVGYFSNPLEPFDAKRPQYLAPEENSVAREQREQQALEGRADAFTFPRKTKQQRVQEGRKNKRDAVEIPSFRWKPCRLVKLNKSKN